MRSVGRSRMVALVLGSALLAACGEGTAPNVTQNVTVDELLAEMSSEQTLSSTGMLMGGGIPVPMSMPGAAACPYDASSSRFVCPSRTTNGLTFSVYYQLLDASGRPQSELSPATTAAIRTVSDVSGTLSLPSGTSTSITLTRHNDQTLSGLLTDTHTLNGTGNSTQAITLSSTTLTLTTVETITNLVLPRRGSGARWPQSGSITMDMTTGTGPTSRMTMTFNGTSTVTMAFSSGSGTRTCTIDLQNPSTIAPCL